jgi:hypothetical protein
VIVDARYHVTNSGQPYVVPQIMLIMKQAARVQFKQGRFGHFYLKA